ncbi:MAG: hypothetical protein P4L59_21300 [Desulfosporosinus sp.]|nr:hypothetical protein [Desulfosporosinus sp.]
MICENIMDEHCPQPPSSHLCPCHEQEYVLSDGVRINIEPGKEKSHDFILIDNPFRDCGTLSGFVRNKCNKPIKDALIKVFDKHHKPITHLFTNEEGQFLVCLPPGEYIVKAVR